MVFFSYFQVRKLTCPNANDYVQSLGSEETCKNRKVVIAMDKELEYEERLIKDFGHLVYGG